MSYDVAYTDVQGGWPGDTNIDADPLFVDPDGADNILGTADDDLRLTSDSPCIDRADNLAVPADAFDLDRDGVASEPIPFDLANNIRFADAPLLADSGNGTPPIVDMGAYEYQGTTLECALADADACTCEGYASGVCVHTFVEYGNADCVGPHAPQLDDILCVYAGFTNFSACVNGDIAPPCTGNNIINLDDILAVLAAFGGADPCGCP